MIFILYLGAGIRAFRFHATGVLDTTTRGVKNRILFFDITSNAHFPLYLILFGAISYFCHRTLIYFSHRLKKNINFNGKTICYTNNFKILF